MPPIDVRRPLNYRGDATEAAGKIMGPNAHGEWFVVDEATYDPAAGRTTLLLRYATTHDMTNTDRVAASAFATPVWMLPPSLGGVLGS